MSADFKNILVHLDDTQRCAERVALATQCAVDFEAHLTGVYAAPFGELPSYARAEMSRMITDEWRRRHRERAEEAALRFREHAARVGLTSVETRIVDGDSVAAAATHARYADLVVLGQPDPDEDASTAGVPVDFAERVLQAIARPVLLVPYAGTFPCVGRRVLIAWDTSHAATRAVSDALPLLKRAEQVVVLSINPETTGDHGEAAGADLALYLARHGVNVEAVKNETRDVEPGTWLISRASDLQSDLIVMGGYGHSALRELIFGGVTRSVMGQMTVPVLMEH